MHIPKITFSFCLIISSSPSRFFQRGLGQRWCSSHFAFAPPRTSALRSPSIAHSQIIKQAGRLTAMPLPPNLHLLVPSSTPDVLLEARLYPFPCPHDLAEHLMRMPSDQLPRTEQLSSEVKRELRAFRAMRVVMGSHPWGKLGGTQLDP